ncbi:MAG TPA: DNA polymerase [Terriglobales bacterium]|jgi:DNA polymerase I-like protein with 3'-5' exonuclease and polymerase domains|nr:DNA polymerase [Terriglobales bacterium]
MPKSKPKPKLTYLKTLLDDVLPEEELHHGSDGDELATPKGNSEVKPGSKTAHGNNNSASKSQEIEEKLPPVLQEIETTGFLLNNEVLEKRIAYFTKHKEDLRIELVNEFDKMKNLKPETVLTRGRNRGRQLIDLGLDSTDFDNDNEVIATLNRIPGVSVTSRSKVTLLDLADKKPEASKICELLIAMNHCDAMIHNHGERWREKAVDGYLYPKHKPERTATGRLASDFQQWQRPERIPDVPELREMLSPKPGMTFVYTDFSQIEVRIAAHESKDAWLLGILNSGEDVHAKIIADTLCKEPEEFLTAYKDAEHPKHEQALDVRSKHKGATFIIIYGATARGMAETLGISTKKAEEIITKFFSKATALRDYAAAKSKEAVETNQVTTPRGFNRKFDPEVLTAKQIARRGMNTPIQSGCADLLKLSMIYMREEFRKPPFSDQEPAALLANSMHDEVIAQTPPEHAELVKERMADALRRAVDELFPGIAWDFLKEIKISEKWLK